jgi:predicted GTPase
LFHQNKWVNGAESEADELFLEKLAPNTEFTVRGRVFLTNDTWSDPSPPVKFQTLAASPNRHILMDPQARQEEFERKHKIYGIYQIPNDLKIKGVKQINILLLGRMGAGKSSLLNTTISTLAGHWKPYAIFRSDVETVSKQLKKYPITPDGSICIWDSYGWSGNNYKGQELDLILEGYLQDGYVENPEGVVLDQKRNKHWNPSPTINDQMHAVILVISAHSVGSESEMTQVRDFFKAITNSSRRIQPIVALTKLDEQKDHRARNMDIYNSAEVHIAFEALHYHTKIPKPSILPAINYQGPFNRKNPNYIIQLLNINLLEVAIDNAISVMNRDIIQGGAP